MKIIPLLALLSAVAAGCSTGEPVLESETSKRIDDFTDTAEQPVVPSESEILAKEEIVDRMEKRMRVVLGETVRRFDDIRARFRAEQQALAVPFVLEAVELPIRNLYAGEERAYEENTQRALEEHLAELDKVLEYVTDDDGGQIWKIAFELVGTTDVGAGYDTRTGIKDVDEIAQATLELVRFRAGRDEFLDDAESLKRRRHRLARTYKHDVKGQGRLAIYATEPIYHFFSPSEDGIAYSVMFHSELPAGTPIEFRQIVRNRITRGGSNLYASEFKWDRTAGADEGRLLLKEDGSGGEYVVSRVFLPRVDADAPGFASLRDCTAVRDYKTAVVQADTGKILDCVSWQLMWHISHAEVVTVDKGSLPVLDEEAAEIAALIAAR